MVLKQMPAGSNANRRAVHGILLLDKPSGCTSNSALQRAKRLFNARKAGHTGSLDPLASGMLPLCFGEATKVSAFLLGADKSYRVTARLGLSTDTADADGEVVARAAIPALDEPLVREVLKDFLGESEQIPPMYSALKVQGRRLYEMARKGEQVDRVARPIVIHGLTLVRLEKELLVCDVRCSKGTYVRALVEDIAIRLGTLAHVQDLRRTGVGDFGELPMLGFEQLEGLADEGRLDETLLPVDAPLADWPRIDIAAEAVEDLFMGRTVIIAQSGNPGWVRVYGPGDRLVGLAEAAEDGKLVPRRMFPGLRAETDVSEAK